MHLLLTNDDGIAAPGLKAAARAIAEIGSVTVVAPTSNCSGYGAALPPRQMLPQIPYIKDSEYLPGMTAFAIPATPAICVAVGLSGVLNHQPVDLVVSGVNDAANFGRDVIFSGTVGAALTAHVLGVPALAISLDVNQAGVVHWDTAAWAIHEVIAQWRNQPEPVLLNVNVPNLPLASLKGILHTELSHNTCLDKYEFSTDAHEQDLLTVTPHVISQNAAPMTDAWAVAHGFVSVTMLKLIPDILCVVPLREVKVSIPAISSLVKTELSSRNWQMVSDRPPAQLTPAAM